MKTPTLEKPISIESQVRKMKEDHAARYGYDSDMIALAAREWEAKHPERMATSGTSSNDELGLDEILQKINPENLHEEVNWGTPVGKEAR